VYSGFKKTACEKDDILQTGDLRLIKMVDEERGKKTRHGGIR
jgi:hypothetical protein